MARPKSALVFLMLMAMVLIFSPWADAPSPGPDSAVPVTATAEPAESIMPNEDDYAKLRVSAALDPEAFELLQAQSDSFRLIHPEIEVELIRVEPSAAYYGFKQSAKLEESSDILLLPSEWVLEFAASGYLLPADSAYTAKALAEQFNALTGAARWLGYLWAVPRDMDPYVTVWNTGLLREWLGAEAEVPATVEQWTQLAVRRVELEAADAAADAADAASWLALDGRDPHAMLSWLETAAGGRSDDLWSEGGRPWEDEAVVQALTLLDQYRSAVLFTPSQADAGEALRDGRTVAALLPYSAAVKLNGKPAASPGGRLEMDARAWELPYVWPRGTSFAISSLTKYPDAAAVWIAGMTEEHNQTLNQQQLNVLPVYRSAYKTDPKMYELVREADANAFPNVAPRVAGPGLPGRLTRLGELWTDYAAGRFGAQEWAERWTPQTNGQAAGGRQSPEDEPTPAGDTQAAGQEPAPGDTRSEEDGPGEGNESAPDEPASPDGTTPAPEETRSSGEAEPEDEPMPSHETSSPGEPSPTSSGLPSHDPTESAGETLPPGDAAGNSADPQLDG